MCWYHQDLKNENMTHDVSFELKNEIEDSFVISSPISTEMLVDDHPLLDVDAPSESNAHWNRNILVNLTGISSLKSNKKVNMKPNGVFFRQQLFEEDGNPLQPTTITVSGAQHICKVHHEQYIPST
jgi:hypothetical protein